MERRIELVVLDGRVRCPLRGTIDVERCYTCRDLIRLKCVGPDVVVCCRLPLPWKRDILPEGDLEPR